ncbi:GAF domain-containing protein [Microlunatus soli]|nr:GAF domain-containing protein [Microlunatus soli]
MRQVDVDGEPVRVRHPDLRRLDSAHDAFVETGASDAAIRPLVLDSWHRSIRAGFDPEHSVAPFRLDADQIAQLREQHPLAAAMPVIRQLLVEEAAQAGMIVAVSDAAGRLLWVEGNHRLRSRAEQMNFVEGTSWTEDDVGTNAPGTALALDREVQIYRAEHLARHVTPWSCSAAPVHDPDTGSMLGVLDLTGGDEVVGPTSLALVRATVRAVESELRIARLVPRLDPPADRLSPPARPRLQVLGRHAGEWRTGSQHARLSLRHSEILVLLQASADGLTGDELGAALSRHPLAAVTVRAELSRLRQTVLPYGIHTRPYRLGFTVDADVEQLVTALRHRDHRRAVELYRGPLLPQSEAPAIIDLRTDLHLGVRQLLLTAGDPDSLLRFADTDFARDDLELWEAAAAMLPPRSPRSSEVDRRIQRLRSDY